MNAPPGNFGGPPPGNFGGPPPGDFGGQPQGNFGGAPPVEGGPPMGGGYGPPGGPPMGGPTGGPFGAPPGPFGGPMMGGPIQNNPKSGSNVGLFIGLGCGGLALLGVIGGLVAVFMARKAVSSAPPSFISPSSPISPADPAPAPTSTGDLKAELKELTLLKPKYGKSLRFMGEISNTGADPIGYPGAKVTFYDAAGTAIDSGTCASLVRVLPPSDKVPCAFSIFKGLDYKTYKIEMTPRAPIFHGQVADIDITDIKFTPKRGFKPDTLEGKLTNKSTFKAKNVWAIVSLYDANKKLVGTDNALVAGNDLDAGQSGLFSSKVYEVAGKPDSYRVVSIGYSE